MKMIESKKPIEEFTVEHFLRRLRIRCPRCNKQIIIHFSIDKGPWTEYEPEKAVASIKTKEDEDK